MVGKSKKNQDQALVDIHLNEYLTSSSCSKVVIEIIKYLAYQKQQIPYPFEQLKLLVNRKKISLASRDENAKFEPRSLQLERHYSKAAEAVNTLENIFQNIEAEFLTNSEDETGRLEEIVVLFGATPFTPKDVFRIQLPLYKQTCEFETPKPPSRKTMGELLRSLLESESLHFIISQPLSMTNTFVFFKRMSVNRRATTNKQARNWFLPRENFRLPQKGRQALLKIECISEEPVTNFDSPLAHPLANFSDLEDEMIDALVESDANQESSKEIEKTAIDIDVQIEQNRGCIFSTLSNHLVFKTFSKELEDCKESSTSMDGNMSGNAECCDGESEIKSLNDSLGNMHIESCRLEINTGLSSIEWFEARVSLRGFKDYIVNGVSAINA